MEIQFQRGVQAWFIGLVISVFIVGCYFLYASPLLSPGNEVDYYISESDEKSDTGSEEQCEDDSGSYYDNTDSDEESTILSEDGSEYYGAGSMQPLFSPPEAKGPACGKDTKSCPIYCPVGYSCGGGKLCCPPRTTYDKTGNLEICEPECGKGQTKCSQYCCDDVTQKCEVQVSLLGKPKVSTCVPKSNSCDTSKGETACKDKDKDLVGCCTPNQKCETQTKPTGLFLPRTVTITGCTAFSCSIGEELFSGTDLYAGYNVCCATGKGMINSNGFPSCTP